MAEKKFSANAQKVYGTIVDDIIKKMESGKLNWEKTWDGKVGMALCPKPCNPEGKPYKNVINNLVCSMVMREKNSSDPRFFGPGYIKSQAKEQSEKNKALEPDKKKPIMAIKLGAKSHPIVGYFKYTHDKDGNELPKEEQRVLQKVSWVFHADDVVMRTFEYDKDGQPVYEDKLDKDGNPVKRMKYTDEPLPPFELKVRPYTHEEQNALAEEILNNSGAVIKYDQADRAFYRPSADEIHLPKREAFPEIGGFYSTALHELAHWTGHSSRLNRDIENRFGTPEYAKEELRAELASTFISLDTGLPMNLMNHAAYTQNWIQILKDDKMEFIRAANDAYKITDMFKSFVKDKELLLSEGQDKALEEVKKEEKPKTQLEEVKNDPFCYKYYAKTGRLTPGGIPTDNLITMDYNDKQGAVYYSVPLTKEVMEQYELEKDPYHQSNNLTEVIVYKQKSGAEFNGKNLMEIGLNGEPLDFIANYEKTHSEYFTKSDFTLEKFSDFYNQPGNGRSELATGDIIQVDDQLYFHDGDSYKEIKLLALDGKNYIVEQDSQEVTQRRAAAIEQYGEDMYDAYTQKYRMTLINNNKESADDYNYNQFFRDNVLNHGLSTITPGNEYGWKEFDKSFIKHQIQNIMIYAVANDKYPPMIEVSKILADEIQQNSPYVEICNNDSYGRQLVVEVTKEPNMKAIIEEYKTKFEENRKQTTLSSDDKEHEEEEEHQR